MFYSLGILIGIVLGLWIAWGIENISPQSYKNQIELVIEVCEHDLPRYKHCEITGVVKEK